MWIFLNDCFLSIVSKDCARDELLVRARRPGDLEKIFPSARVKRSTASDYLFRAVVPRCVVESALVGELNRITYPNFKDSVDDKPLHDAYLRVWSTMANLQDPPPYRGGSPIGDGHHRKVAPARLGLPDVPEISLQEALRKPLNPRGGASPKSKTRKNRK